MNKKIVVGISGGIDSAVTCKLLKDEGYEVLGVTMITNNKNEELKNEAIKAAQKMSVPLFFIDYEDNFEKYVIDNFINEYKNGRTPNPCIVCNRYVKIDSLLKKASELGADFVATGHYAKVLEHPVTKRLAIKTSEKDEKDQSYALCRLTQEQLKKLVLPLGKFSKPEIREIAKTIDMEIANKPESQDICFIPDNDYVKFIENRTGLAFKEGNYVDKDGKVLGKHKGIINYTIGQRKGLGVSFGVHKYVKKIIPETNEVLLCDNEELFEKEVIAKDINYMAYEKITDGMRAECKIRYNHKKAPCTLKTLDNGNILCVFDTPQRAITPGQTAVFYEDNFIIAAGTII